MTFCVRSITFSEASYLCDGDIGPFGLHGLFKPGSMLTLLAEML